MVLAPTAHPEAAALSLTLAVEALAKRLDAGVEVSRANPGTVVSIVHAPVAVELELHAPLAVTRQ